jgi:hypothetical protein
MPSLPISSKQKKAPFESRTMWSKGNLNVSCTFQLKTLGMREYNRSMWNSNKKTLRGSRLDIHAQAAKGGA